MLVLIVAPSDRTTRAVLQAAVVATFLATFLAFPQASEAVVQDESKGRVQFACTVPMERILPKTEGRMLFALRFLPSYLSVVFLEEISAASNVPPKDVAIYDVVSDGTLLYVYTRITFTTPELASDFFDMVSSKDDRITLSNDVRINSDSAQLYLPGQIDSETYEIRRADVFNFNPTRENGGFEGRQIGQISAAVVCTVVASIIVVIVIARRIGSYHEIDDVADDSSFVDNLEPVDVQCINTATSSQKPAQAPDVQPPVPPSAPPAGLAMK